MKLKADMCVRAVDAAKPWVEKWAIYETRCDNFGTQGLAALSM